MKSLQNPIPFEEACTAIRTAERLLAEARFYNASEPALAQKLLSTAHSELRQVLSYAREEHQDTARIEKAILEIEKLGGLKTSLA
ncbi:hypothetical protein [Deinococcus roseus]|uniref:Uncharacterized protein n=1 Tax=Deinococcus roseus TaxID=392414 RepID=A0ABQ2CUB3_9DEIO|nr:hypothetical protein [Deinococcus roseus]GGJ18186.1 hypothetical protein GCM10008938_00410 [Deinococcus roseus]